MTSGSASTNAGSGAPVTCSSLIGCARRAGRARAVEDERRSTPCRTMAEAIDRDDVRDVLWVLEGHASRCRELRELRWREIVGRAPDERRKPRDARPRPVDRRIDRAFADACE